VGDKRRANDRTSGFKSVKQVGVAVSIGFPLLVIGVLTLVVFLISWVGTTTTLWIIAGVILALGLLGSLSRRVI
jgi:Flp pilus assembly protein TadB